MASPVENLRGAGWIVLSALIASVMSAGVHALAGSIHSAQTVFIRGVFGFIVAAIFIFPRSDYSLKTERLPDHLLRGIIGVIAINCGFYSLMILPLVTVTALFFTTPLFVTILSVTMLGEKVGLRRLSASLIGFFGAVLVIGYLPQQFTISLLTPIAASMAFALTLVLGKKLSRTEKPGTILFYFTIILSIGSFPPAIIVWETPSVHEWLLLLLVGAASSCRNYFDIRGYAIGDAHFVAPFLYSRMLFMGIAGYFIFGQIPSVSALSGACLIAASTLYIVYREMKLRHISARA